jgi:transposase
MMPTALEMDLAACGASHHRGRALPAPGHAMALIPPPYAKPFVRRGKNDRTDAAAISDVAPGPAPAVEAARST